MAIMLNSRSNVYEHIFSSASQPPDSSTLLQPAGIAGMEAIGRWTAFEVPIGNFGSIRGRETAKLAGQATGRDGRYRAIRSPLRASKR